MIEDGGLQIWGQCGILEGLAPIPATGIFIDSFQSTLVRTLVEPLSSDRSPPSFAKPSCQQEEPDH